MKLADFENDVEDVIAERGKKYFQMGHVLTIDEIEKDEYIIEVEGSEDYMVEVTLTGPDKHVITYCNCPYDWGEYCKHQVAALLALRETMKRKIDKREIDLKTSISKLTKKELVEFVLNLAREYPNIRRELRFATVSLEKNNEDDF